MSQFLVSSTQWGGNLCTLLGGLIHLSNLVKNRTPSKISTTSLTSSETSSGASATLETSSRTSSRNPRHPSMTPDIPVWVSGSPQRTSTTTSRTSGPHFQPQPQAIFSSLFFVCLNHKSISNLWSNLLYPEIESQRCFLTKAGGTCLIFPWDHFCVNKINFLNELPVHQNLWKPGTAKGKTREVKVKSKLVHFFKSNVHNDKMVHQIMNYKTVSIFIISSFSWFFSFPWQKRASIYCKPVKQNNLTWTEPFTV